MAVEIIQAYAAFETTDEFGRLGGVYGYYQSEIAAQAAAACIGWWGGPGRVVPHTLIVADGRCYPIMSGQEAGFDRDLLDKNLIEESRKTKAAAWRKIQATLTPDEIEELGLKEPKA
ncbi:hypothetical protein MARCHEWKA_05020 [Brevundimonas phage vB_BpoS-Marchewka]|uniref:Uncharacterized protein n=1 Tax=Brevundimonas phage vB_BpoS-Marchewka TaxID=2948604 RepID=A0A9E7SRB9_9CAUD|nr:hypothetical protein MARCHEWKA_05020 [Brevundimonas phage vB_BpoS-Marchewka]